MVGWGGGLELNLQFIPTHYKESHFFEDPRISHNNNGEKIRPFRERREEHKESTIIVGKGENGWVWGFLRFIYGTKSERENDRFLSFPIDVAKFQGVEKRREREGRESRRWPQWTQGRTS